MNKATIYLLVMAVELFFGILIVMGATWVNNPLNCPNTYQSQTCSGSNLVCGYSGGVTFCYDMSLINPPIGTATSNTDQDSGSYNGGYIMDCVSYDGTAPHCDNGGSEYCDRNSTCYTTNTRDTTCTANAWTQSSCGNCRSGYLNCTAYPCAIQVGVTTNTSHSHYHTCNTFGCDTGYLDCNGAGDGANADGCEILNNGACSIGSLVGTYSGCSGTSGNCVVSTSNFVTGVQANYSTSENRSFLWGWDYGLGNLLFLRNNATNSNFSINSTGCIKFSDSTSQCTASTGSSSGGFSWDLKAPYIINSSNNISFNESYANISFVPKSLYVSENTSLWVTMNLKLIDLITTLPSYLLISGTTNKTVNFNETKMNSTVNNLLASTTFYPTQYWTRYGTESGGNNIGNLSFYDSRSFNITEDGGANALEFYVNFSGVSTFNNVLIREYYLGSANHNIQVEIYDYAIASWESYTDFIGQAGFNVLSIPVLDPSDHVNNSVVQVRFRHIQNGITSHKLYIDYIQLIKGFSAITNIQHDSLSGRDSPNNHPQYLLISGNRTMTGNLNMSGYNITSVVSINVSMIYNVSTIWKNITRYPSGSCEYDNGTAVLFRNPCNI